LIVLKQSRRPPEKALQQEVPLAVETVRIHPEDIPVMLKGLGDVHSRTRVDLSAEIAGRILSLHPGLEAGAIIPEGEVLLRIDCREHQLIHDLAVARLEILKRNLALLEKEYARVAELYRQDRVGNLTSVEKAEQGVNSIRERIKQLEESRDRAGLSLERCRIRAPFSCRVDNLGVELGEYVLPGKKLLTLVDDSDLELVVSLDSGEALQWLRFSKPAEDGWFGEPEHVSCKILWTEDATIQAQGILDRIIRFDRKTRTLVLAIRLVPGSGGRLPVVDGMFCRVTIPGRTLSGVFALPVTALTVDQRVFVVRDSRLHGRTVHVVRRDNDTVFIDSGLDDGDEVVTTRLNNPLENTLVTTTSSAGTGE